MLQMKSNPIPLYKQELGCHEQGLTFICPKQYFCTIDRCIMCSKPDCSTKENYESAKEVVKGYQSIHNKENENEGL